MTKQDCKDCSLLEEHIYTQDKNTIQLGVSGMLCFPAEVESIEINTCKSYNEENTSEKIEYSVDLRFTSNTIFTLGDAPSNTASILSPCKDCAQNLYEALYECKRMAWPVLLSPVIIWTNEDASIHAHDCGLKIMRMTSAEIEKACGV